MSPHTVTINPFEGIAAIDNSLARIRDYALQHKLSAEQIEASFLAGWFAAAALRKDWRKPDLIDETNIQSPDLQQPINPDGEGIVQ